MTPKGTRHEKFSLSRLSRVTTLNPDRLGTDRCPMERAMATQLDATPAWAPYLDDIMGMVEASTTEVFSIPTEALDQIQGVSANCAPG